MDTRFDPVRIIATDRLNNRVVHLSLDGEFLGVVNDELELPAALAIDGDNVIVGELNGRVTILDKAGDVVDVPRHEHRRRHRHESRAAGAVADGLRDRGARRRDERGRRRVRRRVQHVRPRAQVRAALTGEPTLSRLSARPTRTAKSR